jgi:hypothetical protein
MAGTEQNCEPTTDSSVYPSGAAVSTAAAATAPPATGRFFDDDVLVDILRHDRRVLPRGDVGDAAGRNTDQDGDLPVWIVLAPSGAGHGQGHREAAADQAMPDHGFLPAHGGAKRWPCSRR